MQQTILTQAEEIQMLKDTLIDAGLLVEEEPDNTQADENSNIDAAIEAPYDAASETLPEENGEIQNDERMGGVSDG